MTSRDFNFSYQSISKIISEFKANEGYYLSPKYQEAEVRQQFIDKFWDALGWDVYHRHNFNPYEREVRIEKSVMIDGRGKRADYAFFTAPNFSQAKFLAEAKKPSKNLENQQDCFQAIRYGWNSNTPISVLTDFEQFLVLDSRYKPSIETAADRIIKKFHYTEFTDEEKFSEMYFLFSREAVIDNSLEKFAKNLRTFQGARQTNLFNISKIKPVDEEFLNELDEYRVILARAFKKNNPSLDSEQLTEITQRTLDRLVLTRFLVDKVIEEHEIVNDLGIKSGNPWTDFCAEITKLNNIYNGAIFRENTLLDVKKIKPSEKEFAIIRDKLAEKNSSYDFNLIPIHILGSIYERFLGNTIVVDGNRADIAQKPEVRKAGGVYYTPEYIVRYIVENTIGKAIEGKTPEEIVQMRFADIACGSGSFLLGVYDYLLKYHLKFYLKNKTALNTAIKNGSCVVDSDGTIHLSIKHRRSILTNNIYGVDIDAQAIEVTKLSLYLKMLEEAKTGAARAYQLELGQRLLPSLSENIIHGNSLIDYDIAGNMLIDINDSYKLYPMSFDQSFPEVFSKGGFDAIVGNPPYGAEISNKQTEYLKNKYSSATYQLDTYPMFIEKTLSLLKENGKSGLIVPSAWIAAKYNKNLRKILRLESRTKSIVIAPKKVFKDATVETVIIISEKNFPDDKDFLVERWDLKDKTSYMFSSLLIDENNDFVFSVYSSPEKTNLIEKIKSKSIRLAEIGKAVWGVKIYQKGKGLPKQKGFESDTRVFHSKSKEKESHKPLLGGSEIERFSINWKGEFVDYGQWLAEPRTSDWFEGTRILIREVTNKGKIQAAITNGSFVFSNSVDGVKISDENLYSSFFVLGLLNSSLISFYNSNTSSNAFKDTFPKVLIKDLLNFPICVINFNNPPEKTAHDKMVELVQKIIEAKKTLADAHTDKDKTFYERYCDSLDKQIDELVYDLYELSEEERKIVEDVF
jgi:predicted type IV restriction endonuclease